MLARFLYSLPDSRVGYRELEPAPTPSSVTAAYARLVRTALELQPATDSKGDDCAYIVRLTTEARTELSRFRESVERGLRRGGELYELRDWGSKLPGAAVRIAGVFHGLMHAGHGNPVGAHIDAETVLGAIAIAEYLTEHAKAAFQLMGADPVTALARRLLGWLFDAGLTVFSKRDAHRALRVTRASALDEPLRMLVERGYIRKHSAERTGPGRAPSPTYEVNPQLPGQRGQKGQNSDAGRVLSIVSASSGGEAS